MGWSCSRNAGLTMDAITAFCVKQTDTQNVYENKGTRYMIEWSRREHEDGAITGAIFRFVENDRIKRSGSIRIEGNGQISRGPAVLKNLPILRVTFSHTTRESTELYRGEPNEESLYVEVLKYSKQYEKGGMNEHVSKSLGYVPYPVEAVVVDLKGNVVCRWKAAPFQVYGQ